MRKNKKKNYYIVILLLVLGIGFAYITTNLNINGISSFSSGRWKLYFDNVRVIEGKELNRVDPTTSDDNTTSLNYSVDFNAPGDSYSFTVDIVNDGDADAMFKLSSSNITSEMEEYLEYSITYSDGVEISKSDVIQKHDHDTLYVRVKYKEDVNDEMFYNGLNNITLNLSIEYVAKDSSGVVREKRQAILDSGERVSSRMKYLSGATTKTSFDSSIGDYNIYKIKRSFTIDELHKNSNYNVASISSTIPIYMWYESGTIYYYCESLIIYLNSNSRYLFGNLHSILEIDLQYFDTSGCTTLEYMFSSSGIISLDLSGFDVKNVKNMSRMFFYCQSLRYVNFGCFSTPNLQNMEDMFYRCSKLEFLDLNSFDVSSVSSFSYVFGCCFNITEIRLSSWNTESATSFDGMFDACHNLSTFDVGGFNTSKVTNMAAMFVDCYSITSLDLSRYDTHAVNAMSLMFQGCSSLYNLNISNFDTSNVTDMRAMFFECSSLIELNLTHFNTENVTDMSSMFRDCTSLTSLNISSFNTDNVTTMNSMFRECNSLSTININNFNTSNVIDMSYMFDGLRIVTTLDLSSFDTSKVTNMYCMFYDDYKLQTIYVSDLWNVSNVTYSSGMFTRCVLLSGAVSYSNSNVYDATMANYTTGYLTLKV